MDTTDDPIRRAAQALATQSGFADPDAWQRYVAVVRQVLKAIAEPSIAMVDAGNVAMREAYAIRGLVAPALAGDAAIDAAWHAMVGELLGDE